MLDANAMCMPDVNRDGRDGFRANMLVLNKKTVNQTH